MPSGKPDLQGIWQAEGRVGYDLEPHAARHDMPAGLGIVEGGSLPYLAEALVRRGKISPAAPRQTPWPAAGCQACRG